MLKRIQLVFGDKKEVLVDGFSNNQSFLHIVDNNGRGRVHIAQTELAGKIFEITLSDEERELPFDLNEDEYKVVLEQAKAEKEKKERLVRERAQFLKQLRSFVKVDKKCTVRVIKKFNQITRHSGELNYEDKSEVLTDLTYKQRNKLIQFEI